MTCPSCHRPVAIVQPRCLYCGAALPERLRTARAGPTGAPLPEAPAPPAPPRELLVLDLSAARAESLARALALPAFEADQRVRRGGYQLHRIAGSEAAAAEADRLRAAGLPVLRVPETEARVRPLLALAGERAPDGLSLRVEGKDLRLTPGQVFLVVRGPIVREYQAMPRRRRVATARPGDGYRIHLHRRGEPRAVELDPANFEFRKPPAAGSSLLELNAWVEAIAPGAPCDDGFRRLPPALSPATPAEGVLSATRALGRAPEAREKEAPVILENLEQFRFYSAWRAAAERRR